MFPFSPDCSENPFWLGFSQKDCNEKREQSWLKMPNLSAPKINNRI